MFYLRKVSDPWKLRESLQPNAAVALEIDKLDNAVVTADVPVSTACMTLERHREAPQKILAFWSARRSQVTQKAPPPSPPFSRILPKIHPLSGRVLQNRSPSLFFRACDLLSAPLCTLLTTSFFGGLSFSLKQTFKASCTPSPAFREHQSKRRVHVLTGI
jgi:hypothetical protein